MCHSGTSRACHYHARLPLLMAIAQLEGKVPYPQRTLFFALVCPSISICPASGLSSYLLRIFITITSTLHYTNLSICRLLSFAHVVMCSLHPMYFAFRVMHCSCFTTLEIHFTPRRDIFKLCSTWQHSTLHGKEHFLETSPVLRGDISQREKTL